jgi:hypothetical protein
VNLLERTLALDPRAVETGPRRGDNALPDAPVATENRIRAGADAAMGYPRFGMIDLLKLLGGLLVGVFRRMRLAKPR